VTWQRVYEHVPLCDGDADVEISNAIGVRDCGPSQTAYFNICCTEPSSSTAAGVSYDEKYSSSVA
jgi:hypothetical protein